MDAISLHDASHDDRLHTYVRNQSCLASKESIYFSTTRMHLLCFRTNAGMARHLRVASTNTRTPALFRGLHHGFVTFETGAPAESAPHHPATTAVCFLTSATFRLATYQTSSSLRYRIRESDFDCSQYPKVTISSRASIVYSSFMLHKLLGLLDNAYCRPEETSCHQRLTSSCCMVDHCTI